MLGLYFFIFQFAQCQWCVPDKILKISLTDFNLPQLSGPSTIIKHILTLRWKNKAKETKQMEIIKFLIPKLPLTVVNELWNFMLASNFQAWKQLSDVIDNDSILREYNQDNIQATSQPIHDQYTFWENNKKC